MNARKEDVYILDKNGNPVSGSLSIPDDACSVLVMSHGFTSHRKSNLYIQFEKEFNDAGIGTLRYEYYGHGPAYGFEGPGYGMTDDVTLSKTVESLRAIIRHTRSFGDYGIGLLGSSYGGSLSIIIASEDPSIKALGTKSSVTEPIRFWRQRVHDKLGDGGLAEWEQQGYFHYEEGVEDYFLPWKFWKDIQDYDVLGNAEKIKCPTLIVHGDADTCVPIDHSYDLARAIGTDVKAIKGAGHAYSGPGQYHEMKRLFFDFFVENL